MGPPRFYRAQTGPQELFPNVTSDDQGPATEREVTATLRSQRQGPDLVGVLGGGGLWYLGWH